MKWAFIDYENVGKLNRVNLSNYEKTIVFVGAKQKQLNFGDDNYTKPIDFTYIKIAKVNKNNLDLHMAYYLADYNHIAAKHISFEVISNDQDLTSLITHINNNGRSCRRVGWATETQDKIKSISTGQINNLIQNIVKISVISRPKTTQALGNHIKKVMRCNKNIEVQKYIQHLVKAELITLNKKLVTYI
jgi:hypothetical protein